MTWGSCVLCPWGNYQNVHKLTYIDYLGIQVSSSYLCATHRQKRREWLASRGATNIQTVHNPADPKRPGLQKKNPNAGARLNSGRRRSKASQIAERDGWVCHWCGRELSYDAPMKNRYQHWEMVRYPTIDHVVERREGGSNNISNLVLSCQPCNNDRSNPKSNPTKSKPKDGE